MSMYLKYFDLKMNLLTRAHSGMPNWEYWWAHWVRLDNLIRETDKV